jgi:hypothetical protein
LYFFELYLLKLKIITKKKNTNRNSNYNTNSNIYKDNTIRNNFSKSAANDILKQILKQNSKIVINTGNEATTNMHRFISGFDKHEVYLLKKCYFISNGGINCYSFEIAPNNATVTAKLLPNWDEPLNRSTRPRLNRSTSHTSFSILKPIYFDDECGGNESTSKNQLTVQVPINLTDTNCIDKRNNISKKTVIATKIQDLGVKDSLTKILKFGRNPRTKNELNKVIHIVPNEYISNIHTLYNKN